MTVKYSKKKSKPSATVGYRTSDFFKGKTFGGKKMVSQKFNTSTFKTQHKG